jgi:hypothetical protein
MDDERRQCVRQILLSIFQQSLDERVDRSLSVNHQRITGNHHFAHASAECLDLYRDGYFLSCVMVTQAVGEGIAKFVAERNAIARQNGEKNQTLVCRLRQHNIVSTAFEDAFCRIQGSFRNDYHHMNPPIGEHDHRVIAERNIRDLAILESEVFECHGGPDGTLVPAKQQYWDLGPDGTIPVYARLF